MGLKTTNYRNKDYDYVMPTAYAKIISMKHKEDGYSIAIFGVRATREAFDDPTKKNTITEEVHFQFDKKSNPYEVAYNLAKSQVKREVEDENGVKQIVVHTYPFFGWENNIV